MIWFWVMLNFTALFMKEMGMGNVELSKCLMPRRIDAPSHCWYFIRWSKMKQTNENVVFWEVPIDFGSECPDAEEDNVVLTDRGDRFKFMKAWWSSVLLRCNFCILLHQIFHKTGLSFEPTMDIKVKSAEENCFPPFVKKVSLEAILRYKMNCNVETI